MKLDEWLALGLYKNSFVYYERGVIETLSIIKDGKGGYLLSGNRGSFILGSGAAYDLYRIAREISVTIPVSFFCHLVSSRFLSLVKNVGVIPCSDGFLIVGNRGSYVLWHVATRELADHACVMLNEFLEHRSSLKM